MWLIRSVINIGKFFIAALFGRNFKELPNSKRRKLLTTTNNLLFSLRNADERTSKVYIDFKDKKYFEIEYGEYTVPVVALENNEKISAKIILKENHFISLGFGILDKKIKKIEDYHLLAKFLLVSDSNEFLLSSFERFTSSPFIFT